MKKILIAMMMIAGATNAHAFEFNVNGNALLTTVIQQIVTQTVGIRWVMVNTLSFIQVMLFNKRN